MQFMGQENISFENLVVIMSEAIGLANRVGYVIHWK